MDLEGKVVGRLPEQVPFQEWAHSSYRDSRSCQSCHMPAVDGETPITGVLGKPRNKVGRHVFLAANFFMPKVFNRFRSDTGVAALPQELDAAARRTVEHLQTASAGLTIESLEVKDGRLEALVRVDNAAGHKLPTAYPSRRAWVHFTVRDGRNEVVFESGRFNRDGSIAGNDNDADGNLYEPHYGRVEKQDQVQVYEAVMAGPDDKVTTVLLTAVRYLKDNRLLPNGFVKTTAGDDIAVKGGAAEDGDFTAGGDRVLYIADLGQAVGPFQVEAELWYQPIGYRWARNLGLQESAEGKRFLSFYDQLSEQSAVVLAKCSTMAKTP
jgi:hypothetical protein